MTDERDEPMDDTAAPDDQPQAETEPPAAEERPTDEAPTGASTKGRLMVAAAVVVALVVGGAAGWGVARASSDSDDDTAADRTADGDQAHHGGDHQPRMASGDGLDELLADHHFHPQDAEPIDSATRRLLTAQLMPTLEMLEQYPTIADAEAGDWRRAGPFIPGLGTHYLSRDLDHTFTIKSDLDGDEGEEVRPVLIYDGLEDDAPLAGFMFMATDGEPEGFVGSADMWHQHTNICVVTTDDAIELPFVGDLDTVTDEMCADRGGTVTDLSAHMVHVWSVPGYESELGLFSEVNPLITCPGGHYHRHPYDQLESDENACRTDIDTD